MPAALRATRGGGLPPDGNRPRLAPDALPTRAEEGVTYYVDPVTKEASWEKPAALQWRAAADEQVGGEHAVQPP